MRKRFFQIDRHQFAHIFDLDNPLIDSIPHQFLQYLELKTLDGLQLYFVPRISRGRAEVAQESLIRVNERGIR